MMIFKMNNSVKLALILSLLCSAFSLGAAAQEKPLKAKALAALIVELEEVVSKNSPNENDARLIMKKWDQRRNLTGKTKSAIINLVYEDVKAVIKSAGVQYQIYSIFSFTKQIPDEHFADAAINRNR